MTRVRIASLVPHATELLFALGAGEDVVGVTHECDYPPAALELPHLTRDALPAGLSAREIDEAVRERTLAGHSIYELDGEALLEADPELIITQALCPVCAVSYEDVRELARTLPSTPRVIALDPRTLGETLGDVRTVAQATGRRSAGVDLIARSARRIDQVRLAVRGATRVAAVALEWLDPPYLAGHWTPQLIDYAGGEDTVGLPGEPSEETRWESLAAAEPEIVLVMPCGLDAERALQEALTHERELSALGARRIVALDGGAYFSRPGPRLVDGVELLAHVLHPERVPKAPAGARVLELEAAAHS